MAVDPKRAEAGLQELVALYRDAQREVAAQVAEAIRSGEIRRAAYRRAAHQRIVAYLGSIGVESDALARNLIENAWREGDSSILRVANPDMLDFTFNVINRDAMEEMQRALTASLLDARATVGRQTFDVFRRAGLQSTMFGLLGASGSTRTVSQDVMRRLEQRGIKAFVDRTGREWSLRSYSQMVARTTTREAVTAAQLSRMADQGIELARVSMSGNPCPICAEWQGKLVSLDGRRDTFDGEEVTALADLPNGGPPFHPNCRHYWSPESVVFGGQRTPPAPRKPDPTPLEGDDALRAVRKQHEGVELDETVRRDARRYTTEGDTYEKVNSAIREGTDLAPDDARTAEALREAFRETKPIDAPIKVFRGIGGATEIDYVPGEFMPRQGFVSTSTAREVAEGFADHQVPGAVGDIWEIVVMPGSRALDIEDLIGADIPERELLFEPEAPILVKSVRPRPGGKGKIVTMEIWPT